MYDIITDLMTAIVLLNTKHNKKNIGSKITDVSTCKVIKMEFLDVIWVILIKYNYQTAKARTLYASTDGPTAQPADNPPNSDKLGDVHQKVPELTVRVYWRPGLHIRQRVGCVPDPDPKQRSATVATTPHHSDIIGMWWWLGAKCSGSYWMENGNNTSDSLEMTAVEEVNHTHTADDIDWCVSKITWHCKWQFLNDYLIILCFGQCWEKLSLYHNRDFLWPLARYYDILLILTPCRGTLQVDFRELWDFIVRLVTFLLFARYYGITCVRVSTYAHDS